MRVHGPDNAERAVQTDPTLLRYASAITEQKKCWELLAQSHQLQTLRNYSQQLPTTCNKVCKQTQHVTCMSNNVGSFCPTMLSASDCTGLNRDLVDWFLD